MVLVNRIVSFYLYTRIERIFEADNLKWNDDDYDDNAVTKTSADDNDIGDIWWIQQQKLYIYFVNIYFLFIYLFIFIVISRSFFLANAILLMLRETKSKLLQMHTYCRSIGYIDYRDSSQCRWLILFVPIAALLTNTLYITLMYSKYQTHTYTLTIYGSSWC